MDGIDSGPLGNVEPMYMANVPEGAPSAEGGRVRVQQEHLWEGPTHPLSNAIDPSTSSGGR